MRQTLTARKIPESIELPDHLSHCLRLLPVLEEDEAQHFAQNYLLLPLKKLLTKMNQENPYYSLLNLLFSILKQEFHLKEDSEALPLGALSPKGQAFLSNK